MPPLIQITILLSIFSRIYYIWESVKYSNGYLLSSMYGRYVMKYNQSSVFCLHACVLFLVMEMACIFWFCFPCSMTVDVSPWYIGNITLGLYYVVILHEWKVVPTAINNIIMIHICSLLNWSLNMSRNSSEISDFNWKFFYEHHISSNKLNQPCNINMLWF
jgi:hypothetical protein